MKQHTSRHKKGEKGRTRFEKPAETVPVGSGQTSQPVHYCDDLHARVTRRAYELYLQRGSRQGCALEDWLEAEREILSREPPV